MNSGSMSIGTDIESKPLFVAWTTVESNGVSVAAKIPVAYQTCAFHGVRWQSLPHTSAAASQNVDCQRANKMYVPNKVNGVVMVGCGQADIVWEQEK